MCSAHATPLHRAAMEAQRVAHRYLAMMQAAHAVVSAEVPIDVAANDWTAHEYSVVTPVSQGLDPEDLPDSGENNISRRSSLFRWAATRLHIEQADTGLEFPLSLPLSTHIMRNNSTLCGWDAFMEIADMWYSRVADLRGGGEWLKGIAAAITSDPAGAVDVYLRGISTDFACHEARPVDKPRF